MGRRGPSSRRFYVTGRPLRGCGSTIDSRVTTSQVKHPTLQRIGTVAKPELGTKRLCANCGAKFYDLNKDPIHCPKCGTVHEVVLVVSRSRPEPAPVVVPRPPAPVEEVPCRSRGGRNRLARRGRRRGVRRQEARGRGGRGGRGRSRDRKRLSTTTLSSRSRKKRMPTLPTSSAATSKTRRKADQDSVISIQ